MNIDLSEILGITLRKALIYFNINATEEKINEFCENLLKDEEFLNEYKNIIKFK